MTSPASGALGPFRQALASDHVGAMWAALDAAVGQIGVQSWRDISVPARGGVVPLLHEAADSAASKCFIALTEAIYEKLRWRTLSEAQRSKLSRAFVLPLGSLYESLTSAAISPLSDEQARDVLADAFVVFFRKDDDPETAIEAFKHVLPEAVGTARAAARSRFQQAALEALISEPVRKSLAKSL
jgi:hypothetical protein